jgi:hypothetical protein
MRWPIREHPEPKLDSLREQSGSPHEPAALETEVASEVDEVEEASRDSFPASDAPAWIGMRVGPARGE